MILRVAEFERCLWNMVKKVWSWVVLLTSGIVKVNGYTYPASECVFSESDTFPQAAQLLDLSPQY